MLNKHKRVTKMVVYIDPQDYLKFERWAIKTHGK